MCGCCLLKCTGLWEQMIFPACIYSSRNGNLSQIYFILFEFSMKGHGFCLLHDENKPDKKEIMQKFKFHFIIIIIAGLMLSACQKNEDVTEPQESFADLVVPASFTWSAISQYNLVVNITLDAEQTELFDATPLDLMDMNGNLLDRSTIYNSQVVFNFILPSSEEHVRLYSPLVNQSMDVQADEAQVVFDFMITPNKEGLIDSDGDGIADRFDDYPDDPERAYGISFPASVNKKYFQAETKMQRAYDPNYVDFEEGNRDFYRGYCWQFYSTATNTSGIPGYGTSVRTGQLSNMPNQAPPHRVYSPWYEFNGSNTLEFIHKLNVLNGGAKYLDVYLVDEDENQVASLLEFQYANTDLNQESIAITQSGIFRIEWHFYGQGGTSRGFLDEIVLDAVDATDFNTNNGVGVCEPVSGGGGDPEPGEPHYDYPATTYFYQIFEDLWPNVGDFDLNDMVLKSKIGWDKHADNSYNYVYVQTIVQAVGAGIPSGLGWEFFKNSGNGTREYLPDMLSWFGATEDPDVNNAAICFDNVKDWQYTPYSNTGGLGPDAKPDTVFFQAYIPQGEVWGFEMLAYLFRSSDPSHQVRTYGSPPTATANMALFGTGHDDSPTSWDGSVGRIFNYPLTASNAFYRTGDNHPWAVEFIASDFKVAKEKTDILQAYPQFKDWAESGGSVNQNWYNFPDNNHVHTPSW